MNPIESIWVQIAVGVAILYLFRFVIKKIIKPAYLTYTGIIIIVIAISSAALIPNTAMLNILYIATCVAGASLIGEKFIKD